MSTSLQQETVSGDGIISSDTAAFSLSRSPRRAVAFGTFHDNSSADIYDTIAEQGPSGEQQPLLPRSVATKKPFRRARPLWLVPFAITAALARGMTLAPRVEVYTQLACAQVHQHPYNHTATLSHPLTPYFLSRPPSIGTEPPSGDDGDNISTNTCQTNPLVQAGAARIQTIMTTTMGLLSALTTGWWGGFGERYGRTTVLAISTCGLFLTDLTFILISTPNSIFATHGHKLLIIVPIIEGLLGGWSTLQSATSAYLSDCTSLSSRATVFTRFTGVFYVGLALGPAVGGFFIHHSTPVGGKKNVATAFYAAIVCSFINFLLVLFVFPESLSKEQQTKAADAFRNENSVKGKGRALSLVQEGIEHESGPSTTAESQFQEPASTGAIGRFLSPLALFLPVRITDSNGKRRREWSLTLLAIGLFSYFLSMGVYQLKYLYAGHVYGWGADQLSYYISFVGAARAVFLLLILPWVISTFKPKPKALAKKPAAQTSTALVKSKPTKAQLTHAINFDLLLAKTSLLIDLVSHTMVTLAPAPAYQVHLLAGTAASTRSEVMFVIASSLTCFGAGTIPAANSLALCIVQARQQLAADDEERDENVTGKLFGALAVLQAVGQMILGPMLFGLIYSNTVAQYPKAIFVAAGSTVLVGMMTVFLIRNPMDWTKKKGKSRKQRMREEEENRGRSRASKNLFEQRFIEQS